MNVHDHLKNKTVEEIKNYCVDNSTPSAVAMFNTNYDFNISTIIRTANAFGFRHVFHIQKEGKKIDKRATVGTHNYTNVIHCYNEDEFFDKLREYDYIPVAVENNINYTCKNAMDYVALRRSCFIFGSESSGLESTVLDKCLDIITLPNYGSVRSLNVATAAGIIMANYVKYNRL